MGKLDLRSLLDLISCWPYSFASPGLPVGLLGAESCAQLPPPAISPDLPHLLWIQVLWSSRLIQFGSLKEERHTSVNINFQGTRPWKEQSEGPEA